MKRTIVYVFALVAMLSSAVAAVSQSTYSSYEEYISRYLEMAQEQQREHGIPASITLAQGLLESAAGGSRLAILANNHFGIKCHDWDGDNYMYKGDCYRKYDDVAQSYHDHSMFLLRKRYAELFSLDVADYKGWANGLKRLGYAEDPQYAQKLISLIERYNLDRYDAGEVYTDESMPHRADSVVEQQHASGRRVYSVWDMLYVEAREGDTYATIASDMGFRAKDLAKYNEKSVKALLRPGEIVYLEKKRRKAVEGCEEHTVKAGETFHSISQLYGIEYRRLARRNKIMFTDSVVPGTVLKLR